MMHVCIGLKMLWKLLLREIGCHVTALYTPRYFSLLHIFVFRNKCSAGWAYFCPGRSGFDDT